MEIIDTYIHTTELIAAEVVTYPGFISALIAWGLHT